MLKLSPSSSTAYDLDLTSSRGSPIAEAGFTVTGLTPTYSNGSGVMTQGQNFVLVGGHTQTAFINMSQVAIWSLPEESWSFQTVDSPSSSSSPNTELAINSTVTSVDSRSGHTAVLTEDGSKIIVLGGWVGDITQAADPQLAVLNIGQGFGGNGDWAWSIPDEQPSGTGMYGHGATMLPGNVMIVLGGHNISSSTSGKRDTTSGTQVMFLNTTSFTWISNYTNPAYVASSAKDASSSSLSHSNAKTIGLGAGLGIGLAAILGAIIVFFCYSRRLKRKRTAEREKTISSLSLGAANYYSPTREMGQTTGGFPWSNGRWNRRGEQQSPLHDRTNAVTGYENLNVGIHGLGDNGGIPLPPRQIPRKPLKPRNGRGLYQPAPSFDFISAGLHGRANSLGTAGPIHPIYEADEDDQILPAIDIGVGLTLGDPSSAPGSSSVNRHSDPFRDPPTATYSSSLRRDNHSIMTNETESPIQSHEREIQEWVSDWAAADVMLNSQAKSHSQAGRLSPTRRAQLIATSNVSSVSGEEDSGRTASNLSERSVAVSAMSVSRSGSSSQGRSRSNSLRGFISNAINPFTSTILSTTVASTAVSPVFDHPGSKNKKPPGSSGSGSSSFTTAHTSFPALQAEGEILLPRPDDFASGENSPTRSQADSAGSPSKSKAPPLGKGRQMGWLGSLRKGFFGSGDTGSDNNSPDSQLLSSREPSPVWVGGSGSPPRRTASAGSTLWRRKQGRGDWEDSAGFDPGMPRSNTFTGEVASGGMASGSTMGDDDDEWDIERAVQNRVVQVMFTVPKEKLRVVNHNVEDDRSDVGSLRSKKGSNRSLNVAEAGPVLEPIGETEAPTTLEGKGKGKSKVLEMVEKMEERSRGNSPER